MPNAGKVRCIFDTLFYIILIVGIAVNRILYVEIERELLILYAISEHDFRIASVL